MTTHFKWISIILFIPLCFSFVSCKEGKKNLSAGNIDGRAVAMKGEVKVGNSLIETGELIPDGSVISTGPDSYCEITFLGGNIIRVFENSLLKVSFSDAMISLDRGTAAAVLRNIATLIKKEMGLFQVESGNVVAGIRGTSFFLTKEDPTTTYFCLCNGSITLQDTTGTLELPVKSSHHHAIRISESGGSVIMSQAEMAYHSDEDMEKLAAQIGQKMDWEHQE